MSEDQVAARESWLDDVHAEYNSASPVPTLAEAFDAGAKWAETAIRKEQADEHAALFESYQEVGQFWHEAEERIKVLEADVSDCRASAVGESQRIMALRERTAALEAALRGLGEEVEKTSNWRKGGMRPATDTSMFAAVPPSVLANVRRFVRDALGSLVESQPEQSDPHQGGPTGPTTPSEVREGLCLKCGYDEEVHKALAEMLGTPDAGHPFEGSA